MVVGSGAHETSCFNDYSVRLVVVVKVQLFEGHSVLG